MTSINVAKGLFRVWVLFGLCWVVPATVIQFDNLTAVALGYYHLTDVTLPPAGATRIGAFELSAPDGKKFNFNEGTSLEVIKSTIKNYYGSPEEFRNKRFVGTMVMPTEIILLCKESKDFSDIYLFCDNQKDLKSIAVTAPIWTKRIRASEWIILPPLVLLLLGYGVLWAFRGFRA